MFLSLSYQILNGILNPQHNITTDLKLRRCWKENPALLEILELITGVQQGETQAKVSRDKGVP